MRFLIFIKVYAQDSEENIRFQIEEEFYDTKANKFFRQFVCPLPIKPIRKIS